MPVMVHLYAIAAIAVTLSSGVVDESAIRDDVPAEPPELRVTGKAVVFAAERDLAKGLAVAASLKRKVRQATIPYRRSKVEIANLDGRIKLAQQQLIGLNAQLVNVNNVATNNRLVGAISVLEGQIEQAKQGLKQLKERQLAARADLSSVQESYIQNILEMRQLADRLDAAYLDSADDAEIAARVVEFSEARGKELTFGPSNTWRSNGRKLADLEESVTTERIPLRRDGGTFYATVVVNGEHSAEMVVDSGATLISLPWELATRMGLQPQSGDKKILLTIADGSTITGYLKTARSVRIGTFELHDVQCAVLGPEATNAEPLLGMSFLGEFQFDVDSAKSTLGLTQIDDAPKKKKR
jgi:clan AA aspartic protease (TIGR02281 family)